MHVTERARAELRQIRLSSPDAAGQTPRLRRDDRGRIHIELEQPRPDDVEVTDGQALLLLVPAEDAADLEPMVLHFRGGGDDRYGPSGFALLPQRHGTPRASTPPPERVIQVQPRERAGFTRAVHHVVRVLGGWRKQPALPR